jgi:hypothetical protein
MSKLRILYNTHLEKTILQSSEKEIKQKAYITDGTIQGEVP